MFTKTTMSERYFILSNIYFKRNYSIKLLFYIFIGDNDILYYQMVFQLNSKPKINKIIIAPRSIIITQTYILLCSEKLYGDVDLVVIENCKLKDINKIQIDQYDDKYIVIRKKSNKLFSSKTIRWKLFTDSNCLSLKLLEEIRKQCISIGNHV
jgi:hypothetical protein